MTDPNQGVTVQKQGGTWHLVRPKAFTFSLAEGAVLGFENVPHVLGRFVYEAADGTLHLTCDICKAVAAYPAPERRIIVGTEMRSFVQAHKACVRTAE